MYSSTIQGPEALQKEERCHANPLYCLFVCGQQGSEYTCTIATNAAAVHPHTGRAPTLLSTARLLLIALRRHTFYDSTSTIMANVMRQRCGLAFERIACVMKVTLIRAIKQSASFSLDIFCTLPLYFCRRIILTTKPFLSYFWRSRLASLILHVL